MLVTGEKSTGSRARAHQRVRAKFVCGLLHATDAFGLCCVCSSAKHEQHCINVPLARFRTVHSTLRLRCNRPSMMRPHRLRVPQAWTSAVPHKRATFAASSAQPRTVSPAAAKEALERTYLEKASSKVALGYPDPYEMRSCETCICATLRYARNARKRLLQSCCAVAAHNRTTRANHARTSGICLSRERRSPRSFEAVRAARTKRARNEIQQ